MQNILIFSHEFPPDIGGAGIVAQQYANSFSQLGYNVTVLTRYQKYYNNNNNSSIDYKIIMSKDYGKLWFLSYKNSINFSDFDLIILNDPAATYVAGLYFDETLFRKSVVFLHGTESEAIFKKPKLTMKLVFFKHFYTKTLNHCKQIVSVSNFMKNKFIKQTQLINLKEKIIVNYTGIDKNEFYPSPNDIFKKKYAIPQNAQTILSVSRIIKEKGYYEMLEIFKKLILTDQGFRWIIVGTGNYLSELQNLVKTAKLEKYVIFTGGMPREMLRDFYSNSDVFWLLSNFDEALPLVYIEAQTCGCPVIGRNKGGVRETISKNSGFLVENEFEVFQILKNKEYLKLKKENIIKFANQFNSDIQAKNLLNAIDIK